MSRPNAFNGMLHEYCVGLGFCGSVKDGEPMHVTDFIPETGPVSADEFAKWLVMADGLDPNDNYWITRLKGVFVKHMGADVVDASKLRSDFGGG